MSFIICFIFFYVGVIQISYSWLQYNGVNLNVLKFFFLWNWFFFNFYHLILGYWILNFVIFFLFVWWGYPGSQVGEVNLSLFVFFFLDLILIFFVDFFFKKYYLKINNFYIKKNISACDVTRKLVHCRRHGQEFLDCCIEHSVRAKNNLDVKNEIMLSLRKTKQNKLVW